MKKVAVIGMSFRFPETCRDSYWNDMLAGRDLVTSVHPSRWNLERFHHPGKSHRGTSYSFAAGSLGDISGFDAGFFGISPREAAQMDPQQRLMLELAWEAFENCGIRPSDVRGSACGVYVGISSGDYGMRMADDLGAIDSLMITGNTSSIAANRISYCFDLHGPSMALDTACSSSLVAFHQACRAVSTGECAMALAGGVSLHLHPLGFVAFSKASMLSRNGYCNVFDAKGDGYVRSEGGGVFVLKDLDQAMADGDPIWAVVAGSLVNTDGRKSGLTVPSKAAQTALLTEAYAAAGIAPSEVAYVEAHGTGTPVGDPVETWALGAALGRHRPVNSPLLIGSVKSNLGHLEAASGAAGLVKALYCLRHRVVPATIHLSDPNPNIHFDAWNLRVVTSNTPLPASGRLVIGVNSFGFGGANAHVILESPVSKVAAIAARPASGHRGVIMPLIVSGKTEAALKAAAADTAHFLRSAPQVNLFDIGSTAALKRDWHEYRAIAFGATHKSLAASLEAFASGDASHGSVVSATALTQPVSVAFVYSGNGSQWEEMGRRLLAEDSVCKAAVLAVEQLFEKYADFSLEAEFAGKNGTGRYARTEIAQPALFALQVGITEMLRSRGVQPTVVAGHSVGEVAAAWASGALTLEQAVQVIFHRSRLQGTTQGSGQMTAVALGRAEMIAILTENGLHERVAIGAVNSPRGVTVSGDILSLGALEAHLGRASHVFKRLDLDYPFHSPLMDPIDGPLHDALADLTPRAAAIPMVSTVTGARVTGSDLTAGYWWRNVRKPVLFDTAITSMLGQGSTLFVEIGPHPVLKSYLDAILREHPHQHGRVVGTLERGDDSPERVWRAASQALLAGAPVDLANYFAHPGRLVVLPNYPWQREALWHAVTPASHRTLERRMVHPLLGYPLQQAEHCWENRIDPRKQTTLADHAVAGALVFPGAAFAELGLAMATQWISSTQAPAGVLELDELDIQAPFVLAPDAARTLRCSLDPADGRFSVKAREEFSEEPWVVHATGRILKEPGGGPDGTQHGPGLPERAPDCTGPAHRQLMQSVGLEYGPAFSAIDAVWVEGNQVWARLRTPENIQEELESHVLHPGLLDCALQLVGHVLHAQGSAEHPRAYIPIRFSGLRHALRHGPPTIARTRVLRTTRHSLSASVELFDALGNRITSVQAIRFRSVPVRREAGDDGLLLESVMVPMPHPGSGASSAAGLAPHLRGSMQQALGRVHMDRVFANYLQAAEPLLDALVASFACVALRQLAGGQEQFSDARAEELVESQPELGPLLVWLLDILEEDGALLRRQDGWLIDATVNPLEPGEIWRALMREHPDHFALTHAVGRVGLHLAELFAGQCLPVQLDTWGCSHASALPLVLGAQGWSSFEQGLVEGIQQHVKQLPPGQRLRIAEFGASAMQLNGLRRRCLESDCMDYVIVQDGDEVSPSDAQASDPGRSTRRPAVRKRGPGDTIDEADRGGFTLVLVVQAFASVAGLQRALRQAREMLAPDGALVFLALPAARWAQFVFGTRHAWWAAETSDAPRQPMAQAAQWQAFLQQEGFVAGVPLALASDAATATAAPSLFIAQRQGAAAIPDQALPRANSTGAPGVWVVHAATPACAWSARLIGQLRSVGCSCVEIHNDDATGTADGPRLAAQLAEIRERHGSIAGLVDLPSTLAPADAGPGGSQHATPTRFSGRCEWAASLARACEQSGQTLACWFVTSDPGGGASMGDAALQAFVRTLRNEPVSLTGRVVAIESAQGDASDDRIVRNLVLELLEPDCETECLLRADGSRHVPRLRHTARHPQRPNQDANDSNVRLGFSSPGQLRNLRWETASVAAPGPAELRIRVEATGLNFRDVMYALGMLPDEAVESGFAGPTLGLECAGTVVAVGSEVQDFAVGEHVVAFGPSCFGRFVTTAASAAARLPGAISTESAATIPTTFLTAYYALVHLGRLREGERVLIHGAAGGVGLAALQIARHLGATIFATAGTEEKRDYLRLAGADHVLDSRSLAFADQIMALTDGGGVDMVLNSLAGEAITRSLNILRPFGRFLELGKRDFYENTRIGLRPLRNNISYFGIDADQLLVVQRPLARALLAEVMELFAQGALHPLPYVVFEADMAIDAFRHMQLSRHLGKVVVTYRHGISRIHDMPRQRAALHLKPDASYLVTGGLGGFGLQTARWLIDKGARHLLLLGRSGAASTEAQQAIAAMQAAGVQVRACACDISDGPALQRELDAAAESMPPMRGIVHAAAVFDDGLVSGLDAQRIRNVFAPKADGAWNLHDHTQNLALDFLVLYSSVTTAFGNPGQAAYVAANASLESLAQVRRAQGLPALCVRWGPIGDAGYLARNEAIRTALQSRTGGHALGSAQALSLLEELLLADRSGLCVADLHWRTLARFLPSASEPQFSELLMGGTDIEPCAEGTQDIARMLAELAPDALVAALRALLKAEIGEILRVPVDKIDDYGAVHDLGLDSLMGVELALAVESRFGVKLPLMVLSDSPTVAKLVDRIVLQLRGESGDAVGTDAASVEAQVAATAAQHAVQADAETVSQFATDLHAAREDGARVRMIR